MFTQVGKRFGFTQDPFRITAVGTGVVTRHPFGDERVATAQFRGIIIAVIPDIAARQYGTFSPGRANAFVVRHQFFQCVFGQLTIGSELAAKDRQQRCLAVHVMNIQRIVAGDGLR